MLAGSALFGPTLAAFAVSKPAVVVALQPPPPVYTVIAVHPFEDTRRGACLIVEPAIRKGPVARTGRYVDAALERWMDAAAIRCLDGQKERHLVLTVSLDAGGKIEGIDTDDVSDLATCAADAVRDGGPAFKPGPARLTIAYFTAPPERKPPGAWAAPLGPFTGPSSHP